MEKDEKNNKAGQTPIIDGDARPDMSIDPGNEPKSEEKAKKGKREKFESERISDQNSLEDFKDAKKA